jgi:L-ascorbate metabolism protein UlaG (beta-lactamase superfamily)
VRGDPTIVNALELPPKGAEARRLHIRPFPAMESMTFDFGRDPDANALYLFTLGGLRVLHIGDIGNPISQEHLDALRGKVDVLFALAGTHATIALEDLDAAIDAIGPRVVVPMHYYSSRGVLDIEPVETFLVRYRADSITRVGGPELELRPESLPAQVPHIYVQERSR